MKNSTKKQKKPLSVKNTVMQFMKNTVNRRKNKTFNGVEVESVNPKRSLSGLRTLRKLREQNVVDYTVIDRRRSLYRLTNIN